MCGGDPPLIWERWTLPMYYAQQRYWSDNPPVDRLVRGYFKIRPKKTPKPQTGPAAEPKSPIDWSLLDG